MQKFVRLFICTILVIAAFGFLPASGANAESYSSYVSGITMTNLSTTTATVTVEYIYGGTGANAGTVASSTTEDIAGKAVRDYAAVPVNNFQGAVVISSSQPIAAMSTITGGGLARGSYGGSATGSKSVLLPFLAKNHGSGQWNTFFAVQNIGNGDTTVTVDYSTCAGTANDTKVVKSRSSVIFDQKSTACLPNGISSAVVTSSTEDILAVVDQESLVNNQALVSSGFPSGSTTPFIPLVNANNPDTKGWRTAITIMNVGNADTTLTLTYKTTTGGSCTETQTIPQQQSKVFAGNTLIIGPGAGVTTTCTIGAKLVGAAYVANAADNTASQPLVAVVNQDRQFVGASAYGGFDPAKATARLVMPLIMDNNGAGKWGTSFNVMNIGAGPVYVKCTFAGSAYVATSGGALPVNGVFEDLQRTKLGIAKTSSECLAYSDAGYTTVDPTAKIIAVVNERALTAAGDGLLTYEAINTTP